jgi:hypothetical protein
MINRTITTDTPITVILKGRHGLYTLWGSAKLGSCANTLSDLTGFTAEHIRGELLTGLSTHYGIELATAAGDLCPIRFSVTVT